MKKKIYILLLIVVVLAVAAFFLPKPICSDNIEEIIQIQVNYNYGEEDSELKNIHFIPEKVIECISKYEEQRTLSVHKGYRMKNVEMHIDFRTKSGTKSIVIGNEIYSYGSDGIKCRILDAENFRKELFDICGVVIDKETNKIIPIKTHEVANK